MPGEKMTVRSKKVSNRLIGLGLTLVAILCYVAIALRLKYGSL